MSWHIAMILSALSMLESSVNGALHLLAAFHADVRELLRIRRQDAHVRTGT